MFAVYLLGVRRLFTRPLSAILAMTGIAAGIALVISVGVVLGSVGRSIEKISDLHQSAEILINSRSTLGIPIDRAAEAARHPNVADVQPQLSSAVLIDGEPALLIGRDDIPAPLAGAGMTSPLTITTANRTSEVNAAPAPPGPGEINGGRVVLVPLEDAWQITGRPTGTIDSATIELVDGANTTSVLAELEAELGPAVYLGPADAPQQIALKQLAQVQQPLFLMATIALVAGGFLIFNTVQSSARIQQRDLAVLRAIGASRRHIAGGLLTEAAVLGLAGSVAGVFLGALLGRGIVSVLPDLVDTVAGTEVTFHWDWAALPGALVAGLVVAFLSAILPIRSVLRSSPDAVLSRRPAKSKPAQTRPIAVVIGTGLLGLGLLACLSPDIRIAQNGIAGVLLGLIVIGLGLARTIARVASRIANGLGSLGTLVAVDLAGSHRRVWSIAAAVFTAVGMSLTVGGAARNQTDTLVTQFAPVSEVDLIVSTTSPGDLPLGFHYSNDSLARLAAIDGVQQVRGNVTAYASREGERFIVLASDHPMVVPSMALAPPDAQARVAAGKAAIVTIQHARTFGLEAGDLLELDGIDGPIQLPIAAVTTATTVSVSGAVHIGRSTFVSAFGDPGVNTIEIDVGDDNPGVRSEIASALESDGAPVLVFTGTEWYDGIIGETAEAVRVFVVVSSLVVALAGLATLNATASSVVERRRILGVLRSIGATPGQVRKIVMIEVAAAGAVGTILGLIFGSALHRLAVYITNNASPFPEVYSFSMPSVLQALVSAVVAIAVGGLLPAWQTARIPIGEALALD